MATRRNKSTSNATSDQKEEDPWECKICHKIYKNEDAKLLECQRCKDHFCIKCLNKSKTEYDILSNSDTMWFCAPCRQVVEEHIVTDLKIEERCREIMDNYEQRINDIEIAIEKNVIKKKVREIAKEEALNGGAVANVVSEDIEGGVLPNQGTVTTVLEEINERKTRENNLIIFGITENESENKQERIEHDVENIVQLFKDAKITLDIENIRKTQRLGKYDKEKTNRPLLVHLKSIDSKLTLFRNMHYIRSYPKYQKVNVSNDLTKSEREEEKRLWTEAKKTSREQLGGLPVQSAGTAMGEESCKNKKVKRETKNVNINVQKKGKVFNGNVNNFTVLPKLNCFYTNADQLFNKMSELIVRTRDNKPNIIGITEVKPKANRYKPSTAEYSIPEVGNYKMFEKNIKSDEGRGLLMYVDSNLEATEITMKTEFQENIFIKVTCTEDVKSDKTDDNKQKAEILSEYFTSVFTNEPQGNIPEPKHIPLDKKIEELNIGTDLVLKHLQKIKTDKSPGPDNLHPRLLFEVKEGIAEPLGIIFSQSLTQKVVPKDWKSALVSAIFKKGNKSQAKNYRPVSLTSVVCKIMEKIIREHIISYMKENKLFSNKQYGFISERSTSLQLLEESMTASSAFGTEHIVLLHVFVSSMTAHSVFKTNRVTAWEEPNNCISFVSMTTPSALGTHRVTVREKPSDS
ncbi:unnamed protein product [Mytilus edulis]|uniref:PHD-type domain-containing protein n=1 Tax=Mytilus edulis TaxID=6550 RepID=A0A8S3SV79_MYTED|nr:unnamed protein product [Mytilus edulis]